MRLLHSLSCAEYKILLKEPKDSRTIDPADTFQYNENFTDKMRRIRVRTQLPEPGPGLSCCHDSLANVVRTQHSAWEMRVVRGRLCWVCAW